MKIFARQCLVAGCALSVCLLSNLSGAQSLDQLKGALGGGDKAGGGSSLPSLGGLGASGLSSGSMGNAAGVIQFCVKNNYLGGDAASVKDRLMSKLGGGSEKPAQTDSGYLSGAKGMLTSGDGKSVDLSGGGLKKELTKKACDQVLAQAKNML